MAMGMLLDWEGVTQEEYDRINDAVNLGDNPADGLILHTAGATQTGWRVFDIWESPEAFERFVETRIGPVMQEIGLERGEPQPQLYHLHNVYAADLGTLAQVGATALSGDRARA
jgi:hypothetical protein